MIQQLSASVVAAFPILVKAQESVVMGSRSCSYHIREKAEGKIVKVYTENDHKHRESKTLCFKKKTIGMNEKLLKATRFKIII